MFSLVLSSVIICVDSISTNDLGLTTPMASNTTFFAIPLINMYRTIPFMYIKLSSTVSWSASTSLAIWSVSVLDQVGMFSTTFIRMVFLRRLVHTLGEAASSTIPSKFSRENVTEHPSIMRYSRLCICDSSSGRISLQGQFLHNPCPPIQMDPLIVSEFFAEWKIATFSIPPFLRTAKRYAKKADLPTPEEPLISTKRVCGRPSSSTNALTSASNIFFKST